MMTDTGAPTTPQNVQRDDEAIGRKAKRNGTAFETIFERACRGVGLVCTRIPDGCRQAGFKRLIRVKTPCDWVLTHKGKTALIDTKSAWRSSFPFAEVDEHQAHALLAHERAGAIAGYVVWMRECSKIVFIPASALVASLGSRGSFKPSDPNVTILGELTETSLSGRVDLARLFRKAQLTTNAQADGLTHDQVTDRAPLESA